MTKPNLTTYQIKELRDDVDSMKTDIKKIMENHLVHLKDQITDLQLDFEKKTTSLTTRVNVQTAINVGSVIIGSLILKYL